jgi:hypothetical protein
VTTGPDAPETLIPHARLVLDDVRLVRERLEDERDDRAWRLDWALAVVLLRTVGDVLDKVDGENDPRVKAVAGELYRSWRHGDDNAIFRDFIKAERDSIVHEYRTAMSEGPIAIVALHKALSKNPPADLTDLLEENLFRPLEYGPYAGEDGRDIVDQAVAWWEIQLDEIDHKATQDR